ncbi:MAG TPA: carbohydrate porin [Rhodocyclaceae bacterium]|nr:carbohydrate porin [Rhodocyclaceae bacterium]
MPRLTTIRRAIPLLLCTLLVTAPATAEVSQKALLERIERLTARLDQLEKHNSELEQRLGATQDLPGRIGAIEEHNARLARSLESEPEMTTRLKAVEMQVEKAGKASGVIEALEGVSANMSLTTIAQRPSGGQNSQLSYRGDISVSLPLGDVGNVSNKFFAHFRLGQSEGLNVLPTYAAPNAAAFRALATQPDDSVPGLAQAWVQTDIPLFSDSSVQQAPQKLALNFGKIDPFIFFDQNAAANDEARQFLNAAFVHNPLLDAGGDIGVDANGFTPGMRLAYINEQSKQEPWQVSLGVFGAGQGAHYTRSFSSPLVIVQAETQQRFFTGQTGNYRLYYWRNGQADDYAGGVERHTGWGFSADQSVADAVTLFGRYGHQSSGQVRFDRALTLGAEIGGSYWNRSGDVIGVAAGRLRTSNDFARDAASVDADGDGLPDYGFAAGGAERIAELYYRYRINKQIELTPDYQIIATPGGNTTAPTLRVAGLRLQLSY